MLDEAEKKNVYQTLMKMKLGGKKFVSDLPYKYRNHFDFVIAGDLISTQHFDETIFEQMLIALKTGGSLIFTAQFSFLGHYLYHDKLEELEKAKRIKFVEANVYYRYDALNQVIGKYTKTPAKVYVYQKTEGDSVLASQMKKLSSMSMNSEESYGF